MEGKSAAKANDDNIEDNSRGSIQSMPKTIGFETNTDFETSTRPKPNTSKPLDQLTRKDSNKSRPESRPARIEPTHDIWQSTKGSGSITDLLSSNGGYWGTPRIRESKSNAVISRLRNSSISSDGSDIANSTKPNYKESESRHSGRNEYVPSKHRTG